MELEVKSPLGIEFSLSRKDAKSISCRHTLLSQVKQRKVELRAVQEALKDSGWEKKFSSSKAHENMRKFWDRKKKN